MALSNVEIDNKMKHNYTLSKMYMGCVSKDQLPQLQNNQCVVLNIQNSTDSRGKPLPGTHWTSAGIKNDQFWYFDSFGLAPPLAVQKQAKHIVYNTRDVQDPMSQLCGYYAMLACAEIMTSHDAPEKSMVNMVDAFNEPVLKDNDRILHSRLKRYHL